MEVENQNKYRTKQLLINILAHQGFIAYHMIANYETDWALGVTVNTEPLAQRRLECNLKSVRH
jgi:hypothetical protein